MTSWSPRLERAVELLNDGELDAAESELLDLLERYGDDRLSAAIIRLPLAEVRERRGDPDGALAHYAFVLEVRPRQWTARLGQASLLYRVGQREAAVAQWRAMVEDWPADVPEIYPVQEARRLLDRHGQESGGAG